MKYSKDINRYRKEYFDFSALFRARSDLAGLWNSIFRGEGGDILRIKPYEPGDKAQNIHKPSFAKGEYFVKEFFGERRVVIWLVFEIAASVAAKGEIEAITAKAAKDMSALFSALICGAAGFFDIQIGAMIYTHKGIVKCSAQESRQCFNSLLGALESMPLCSVASEKERLDLVYSHIKVAQKSLMFFVSDFYADDINAYLKFLRDVRNIYRIDIIPVFIDTSWIWESFRERTAELTGRDVLSEETAIFSPEKNKIADMMHTAQVFSDIARIRLAGMQMPLVHLGKPVAQNYLGELHKRFYEKQRLSPHA